MFKQLDKVGPSESSSSSIFCPSAWAAYTFQIFSELRIYGWDFEPNFLLQQKTAARARAKSLLDQLELKLAGAAGWLAT